MSPHFILSHALPFICRLLATREFIYVVCFCTVLNGFVFNPLLLLLQLFKGQGSI